MCWGAWGRAQRAPSGKNWGLATLTSWLDPRHPTPVLGLDKALGTASPPSLRGGEMHAVDVLADPQPVLPGSQRLAVDRDIFECHIPHVVFGVGAFELH